MRKAIGIHVEPQKQFSPRLQVYEKICAHNNIGTERLCSSESNFWERLTRMDAFIYHWGQWDACRQNARAVLPIVEEELRIPCFPNLRTCWAFDDKIRQYYLARAHGLPMARTWVFWEQEDALDWADTASLPVVFKLAGGAGSRNVMLVRTRTQLVRLMRRMFSKGIRDRSLSGKGALGLKRRDRLKLKAALWKRRCFGQEAAHFLTCPNWIYHKHYALFQEFLPDNEYDTRITTIGARAFVFRRRNRPGDFRSSGSGLIDYSQEKTDLHLVELGLEISRLLGFQAMAYDFLYDRDNNPKFVEMSYTFVDRPVYDCPGYWDDRLNYCEGHYWPQFLQLSDLLQTENLAMPETL